MSQPNTIFGESVLIVEVGIFAPLSDSEILIFS